MMDQTAVNIVAYFTGATALLIVYFMARWAERKKW